MSIFGNIMSAIFGHGAAQAQSKPSTSNTAAAPMHQVELPLRPALQRRRNPKWTLKLF
jgi:hypothetical protein